MILTPEQVAELREGYANIWPKRDVFALADSHEALRAQLSERDKEIERLREYTQHTIECAKHDPEAPEPCECGLAPGSRCGNDCGYCGRCT
jgi:hypothetical protein